MCFVGAKISISSLLAFFSEMCYEYFSTFQLREHSIYGNVLGGKHIYKTGNMITGALELKTNFSKKRTCAITFASKIVNFFVYFKSIACHAALKD